MPASDDSPQRAESRLAFLKHLPAKLAVLARQWRHFCEHGWDINGLLLLVEDSRLLAESSRLAGAPDVAEVLEAIASRLSEPLAEEALPDDLTTVWLTEQLDALTPSARSASETPAATPVVIGGQVLESSRVEMPPAHYWRRWTSDATPAEAIVHAVSAASGSENDSVEQALLGLSIENIDLALDPLHAEIDTYLADPVLSEPLPFHEDIEDDSRMTDVLAVVEPLVVAPAAPVPSPAKVAPPPPVSAQQIGGRIYHLSDSSALSVALDQRLEVLGYELELLEDSEELKEVLTALAPDLVLVDAGFIGELESIGTVLRNTRERAGARLLLLAICDDDTVDARLAARRAGADTLLVAPRNAEEVIAKLQSLLASGVDEVYRVMIVEDDRSQALFAESILRNAGMDVRVVLDALDVLGALDDFHPDMVLMDLYMPDCDGAELTALIRERDAYINLPIVFLSGESDIDKHYDALEAGGDDFLSKPIRPKHLIAAVSSRVRRGRALQQRRAATAERVVAAPSVPRDSTTGLYFRSHVLEKLAVTLAASDIAERLGGILFLDIDGLSALRDRMGLSGIERLLREAGVELVAQLGSDDLAARYSDGCFIVVCPERNDEDLEALASRVRSALVGRAFDIDGRPVRLRLSVGVCPWRFGFADTDALVNAAERLSRDARSQDRGVRRYEPPRRADVSRAEALLDTLRRAIAEGGFALQYQPIVAVQGGDEARYQTLVRLRDESGHLIAAGQFVPLAESYDLMGDVDRWVLDHALSAIALQRNEGVALRLFVSQSSSTLVGEDHAAWLAAQLKTHAVSGEALVIDFALDNIEAHVDAVQAFCRKLVPLGVTFCLSQYDGSDTAELVLERLPVSYIKLAARVVVGSSQSKSRDVLRTLLARAQGKGLQVIAPHVEDPQVAAGLWVAGVDYVQGNLVQQVGNELSFDFQSAVL